MNEPTVAYRKFLFCHIIGAENPSYATASYARWLQVSQWCARYCLQYGVFILYKVIPYLVFSKCSTFTSILMT